MITLGKLAEAFKWCVENSDDAGINLSDVCLKFNLDDSEADLLHELMKKYEEHYKGYNSCKGG